MKAARFDYIRAGHVAEALAALANTDGAKLLAGGHHGDPFLGITLPPTGKRHGRGANLLRRSRERYAASRAAVEDKIRRWIEGR